MFFKKTLEVEGREVEQDKFDEFLFLNVRTQTEFSKNLQGVREAIGQRKYIIVQSNTRR
jgi:hypothetical protein